MNRNILLRTKTQKVFPFGEDLDGAIPNNMTTTPKISRREQQILSLLQEGNSRKMIAAELDLKGETVNSYFKNIYRKLEVNSATQALRRFVSKPKQQNVSADLVKDC
jgi:DNA-binding NarL/FixJ family response regulator